MAKSKVRFSTDLLMAWLCSRNQMDAKITGAHVDHDKGVLVLDIEGMDVPNTDLCVIKFNSTPGPFGALNMTSEIEPYGS